MKDTGLIYVHTNTITGKCYIGKTTQTMQARWLMHCSEAKCGHLKTSKFHNAIRKYGMDVWTSSVIAGDIPIEFLDVLEERYIDLYGTYVNGYNTTKGGEATVGYKHTEEAKVKMSATRKGKYTGSANPMYGKKFTEEHKEKMRQSQIGKKRGRHSEEHRRRISDSHMGKSGKCKPWHYTTPEGVIVYVTISRYRWLESQGLSKYLLNDKFGHNEGKVIARGYFAGYTFYLTKEST